MWVLRCYDDASSHPVEEKMQVWLRNAKTRKNTVEMRLGTCKYAPIKRLVDYTTLGRIIPSDHQGNITTWVNSPLALGKKMLTEHAHQKRGLK